MKCALCLVTLFLLATVAYSFPAVELEQQELDDAIWTPAEENGARVKRATCDLFSFESKWFTPNHAACAAHCIFLGNRGGHCVGTVCHCRK
uniref:Defensin A n=1 Tax=Panstrongylus megistus TaxID=65343 RepID=A0A0N6XWI1_9HEMI|nr:defensin A [Panstrongylus megistus]